MLDAVDPDVRGCIRVGSTDRIAGSEESNLLKNGFNSFTHHTTGKGFLLFVAWDGSEAITDPTHDTTEDGFSSSASTFFSSLISFFSNSWTLFISNSFHILNALFLCWRTALSCIIIQGILFGKQYTILVCVVFSTQKIMQSVMQVSRVSMSSHWSSQNTTHTVDLKQSFKASLLS